jgi:hypothetical protein
MRDVDDDVTEGDHDDTDTTVYRCDESPPPIIIIPFEKNHDESANGISQVSE